MKNERNSMIDDIIVSMNRHTENVAFVIKGREYTYGELKEWVCSIVAILPFENKRVGIIGEDSIQTYAAILAVLLSGNTYVILHPSYPVERNRKIVESADVAKVLGYGPKPDYLDENLYLPIAECKKTEKLENLAARGDFGSYAYIIFTSGSTGEPKGVPISRSNLDAFYRAYSALDWNLDESDRMLQMFELTFDVSVVSFLYPLTLGASIYTVGYTDIKHFKVVSLLEEDALTCAAVTPSLLQLLSPYFEDIRFPKLKYLILTAEASQTEVVMKFRSCAPNAEFINLYGPTESTIFCCVYRLPEQAVKEHNGMVAIGKPFMDTVTLIADENGKQVPPGQQGELLVSGPQVMDGYLNRPDKTEEAFFKLESGERFYRTGDLCVMDEEGDLYYCGRKDHQVKIQGFRIELSEIEYAAKKYFNFTRNVVAVTYSRKGAGDAIALAVEGKEIVSADDLKSHLRLELPYYMIPSEILCIGKFPINNSNKIDRNEVKKLLNL